MSKIELDLSDLAYIIELVSNEIERLCAVTPQYEGHREALYETVSAVDGFLWRLREEYEAQWNDQCRLPNYPALLERIAKKRAG